MRTRVALFGAVLLLGGCDLAIKNGLFACGQTSDCPSGYHCWSSDSRCYDSKEPECEPKSCEQVIGEFATLGIDIECGSLPDGCEGSIECGGCPEGEACGANGQSFLCGCEEYTCPTFGSGAECGFLPTRCGTDDEPPFCGVCLGDGRVCIDNECVCPPNTSCGDECDGRCGPDEACVDGECCTPTYPCSQNECSPPGGFPDGCGGFAECPSCDDDAQCVLGDELVYECLGDCTCEAKGYECGNADVCGEPTLCGTCADNGFGDGYRCKQNRCVCEDPFEYNDDVDKAAIVCGESVGVNCMQEAWSLDLEASLHDADDVDIYELFVLDASTPLVAQVYNGFSDRILAITYICPDGSVGMYECTGWHDDFGGQDVCWTDEDVIAIQRWCDGPSTNETGTVRVAVEALEHRGDCDEYGLKILATYGQSEPL